MGSLLPLILILPFAGAIVAAILPNAKVAKTWALLVTLATAAIGVGLAAQFDWQQDLGALAAGGRMEQSFQIQFGGRGGAGDSLSVLIGNDIRVSISLGVDAISLVLVLLTVGLMPLAILSSFESVKQREKEYYAWMLVLLGAMLGVFLARDLLLFYIFFELTLIPMFFIIGIWGGPDRRFAAGKFFLFTFTGSVFTLAGVVYLGMKAGSFDIVTVTRYAQQIMSNSERFWLLLAFLAGFAVKVPLFPVHTWLPLAHTEAPTAGSVILAGVLLKLGTYGLLRLAVPIGLIGPSGEVVFPVVVYWLGILCLIGIVYGALVAWVQQDIKKLVAYSSVSHLGFCVLGLVALNNIGIQGSVLYMINHGLSTGALFLVIGMIYDRYHTRDINELSGLAKIMPKLAFFFILFTLSSIGLPGTNGFVSEFLTILGAFTSTHLGVVFGAIAALGIILGAVYMLHMAARVIWGPLKTPGGHDDHGHHGHAADAKHHDGLPTDIGAREMTILVPLAIAVIVLGVTPNIILKPILGPSELIRTPIAAQPAAVADVETSVETSVALSR